MNQDAHISFVLDESSSMAGLIDETIASFNKFVEEQGSADGNAYLSLTLFNTDFEVRYVGKNCKDIPAMARNGENAYQPSGGTALYDAVGTAIKGAERWQSNNHFDGRMVVVIQTDGEENSSGHWDINALNDLIKYKQGEGWDFIFMGTGKASWLEAKKFTSIPVDNNVMYSGAAGTTSQTYAAASSSLLRSRASGQSVKVDQSWNDAKEDADQH